MAKKKSLTLMPQHIHMSQNPMLIRSQYLSAFPSVCCNLWRLGKNFYSPGLNLLHCEKRSTTQIPCRVSGEDFASFTTTFTNALLMLATFRRQEQQQHYHDLHCIIAEFPLHGFHGNAQQFSKLFLHEACLLMISFACSHVEDNDKV